MINIPRYRPTLGLLTLSLAAAWGCTRESQAEQGAKPVGSTARNPPALSENEAPLGNIDETNELAELNAKRGESAMIELGRPGADAKFIPLRSQKLSAKAKLEQIGGQVEIRVNVSEAEAGTRRLLLREDGPCTGHPIEEHAHERVLGALKVEDNHHGALVVRVNDANLKPEDAHSLLGRALVLTPENTAKDSAGEALACAQIRSD